MINRFLHICLCFVFITEFSYSQYSIIPTGTTTAIHELYKNGNTVFINGVNNFLAKCNDNCDDLVPLNPPGPLNYYNGHLNVLDTNTIFIASFFATSPYHAIISKSINGGQSWIAVLDTISEDFFIRGLFVFDTNNIVLPVSIYNTFVSSNGGSSWLQGAQHNMLAPATAMKINDSTAIMGSLENFSITFNKGISWEGTGFIQSSPTDFFANSSDSIYAVTDSGIGTYFSYIFGSPQTNRVDKQIPMMDPQGVFVVSTNEIYIIGKGWPQETGRIMKTTDLGDTWSYYNVPETDYLYDMVFINDSIALIGGNHGALVKWNKHSLFSELSIEDNQKLVSTISILPNPSEQFQTIDFHGSRNENLSVKIFDLSGKFIQDAFTGLLNENESTITIDISSLAPGTYQYQIQIGESICFKKFVRK